MKSIRKIALLMLVSSGLASCYEKYVEDFDHSTSQFVIQQPLRTVVHDRGSYTDIYVGVSIGGKREVDMSDWATFVIDEKLLDGVPGKTLMPANYYRLGDPGTMRVRKSNMPVADVRISFTEDFYNDPLSLGNNYVIPFRLTDSSCDEIPEGRDYTLVCVKYVSSFSGTYYIRGTRTQVADADGTALPDAEVTTYYNKNISQNDTRAFTTLSLNKVQRAGVGEVVGNAKYRAAFTLTPAPEGADHDYDVAVTTGEGVAAVPVTHGSGKFYNAPFDVYETDKQARFEVSYIYQDGSDFFRVEEELIRRRDPYLDLRVEEW